MFRAYFLIIYLVLLASPSFGNDSALLSALKYRASLVTVQVWQTEVHANPKAQAVIDPQSGKMILMRQAISATQNKKGIGIIINPHGLIVTNFHTINEAQKLSVTLHNGQSVGVKILNFSPEDDLAFLKIDPPFELIPIPFADSDTVKLRDMVYHIGGSEVLNDTISGALVTGIGTNHFNPQGVELIQLNLNVYKGDSGGPLLNKDGELIGIIVAKKTNKDRTSFAIPANKIKKLYLDLVK